MNRLFHFRIVMSLLFVPSFTVALAAQGEKPFMINGQLKAFSEGKIYLTIYAEGMTRTDSSSLSQGKFSIGGMLQDDIVLAILNMPVPATQEQLAENPFANRSSRMFYLTPGKITASGNRLEDLRFSGTVTMNEFMKIENSKLPFVEASADAGRNWRRINTIPDFPARQDSLDFFMKKFEAAARQLKLVEKDFIKQHPSSLLSMALLREKILQVEVADANELESMVAGLSPQIRNRPDMTKYIERLTLLRTLVVGKPILNFSMPDTSGKNVSLASYRGKWVLVEFWASWCGPCRMEIPNLLKEYAAYKHKNFEILGVSLDDNRNKWLKSIHEEKLPWVQVSDLKGMKSDIVMQYGITGIPLNYLVDPDGNIAAKNLRGDELGKKLKELLGDQGVNFDQEHSWQEVKRRARAENKFILLDCFATWCAPCQQMNKDVFTRKDVGQFLNDKFISVKVQLDKTSKDNDYVKSWYEDVAMIQKEYGVVSLPTFLFFSPDGEFVHRIPGAHDAASFMALAADAMNPDKQYFSLRNKIMRSSKIEPEQLKKLAMMAISVFEKEDAGKFASQYLETQKDLFTRENISFLYRFTWSGKDKGFDVLLKHGDKIDAQMWPGAADEKLREIIFNEELYPLVSNAGNTMPDWNAIQQKISGKYPSQAGPLVLLYRTNYFQGRGDWSNFEKSVLEYMHLYGDHVRAVQLNVFASAVLEHSSGQDILSEALEWSGRSVISSELSRLWDYDPNYRNAIFSNFLRSLPEYLNTYANLLHKLGRTREAIPIQEKAWSMAEGIDKGNYEMRIQEMKKAISLSNGH